MESATVLQIRRQIADLEHHACVLRTRRESIQRDLAIQQVGIQTYRDVIALAEECDFRELGICTAL